MPCFFCIAMVATVGATAIAAAADVVDRLQQAGAEDARVVTDTASTAKVEVDWTHWRPSGRTRVPVAVTAYKQHGRLRIQPLTHDIDRHEAAKVVRDIAIALGARVVDWSDEADERLVREAFDAPEPDSPAERQRSTRRLRAPWRR